MLPTIFTEKASKTIVSCEASSKFHRTSFQNDRFVRCFRQFPPCVKKERNFKEVLIRNHSQQIFSADFFSRSSQQIFSADFLQQIFSADLLSRFSQQIFFSADLLSRSSQQIFSADLFFSAIVSSFAVVRGWWSAIVS